MMVMSRNILQRSFFTKFPFSVCGLARSTAAGATLALFLGLSGCQRSERPDWIPADFTGTWLLAPGASPPVSAGEKESAGLARAGKLSMEINSDHTWSLSGLGKLGKWDLVNGRLTLTLDQNSMPAKLFTMEHKPEEFFATTARFSDSRTMYWKSFFTAASGQKTLKFRRSDQK